MSLFDRFAETKEEGFREGFIKPLLIRLGFFGISNKHGVNEFGKDYVFSEFDGFGHLRHMVVQAKHVEKINQGKVVDELVTQVRQCFFVPYTLPSAPTEERHVSSVYVFNSGEITDNAEKQIRHTLPKEVAVNVRFFSGPQLSVISSSAQNRDHQRVRAQLTGFAHQMNLNLQIWQEMSVHLMEASLQRTVWDIRYGILHGLETFLSNPIMTDTIDPWLVALIWQRSIVLQGMVSRYYNRQVAVADEAWQRDISKMKELCSDQIRDGVKLHNVIVDALTQMASTTE